MDLTRTFTAVGTLCVLARWEIATAVGGVVLLLLHAKDPLHSFANRLGETDVRAIVGGLLGGLVSSTATTASIRRAVRDGMPIPEAALVVTLASAMVLPRQLIEIAAIAPGALVQLATPLVLTFAAFALPILVVWRRAGTGTEAPEPENPAAVGPAIVFGLVFAAVLFAVALAQQEFGSKGIYVVALISGTTDVDAITISAAGLVHDGRLDPTQGSRAILLATVANLACKAGIAGALGGARMLRATALCFAAPFAVGTALAVWWSA